MTGILLDEMYPPSLAQLLDAGGLPPTGGVVWLSAAG